MTKVTNINARSGQTIVDGAMEKLAAYAAELGLAVDQKGRWAYYRDGSTLDLRVTFVVGGAEGLEEKEKTTFALYARSYGLEATDYGNVIKSSGKDYKLVGFNTKARRYPFLMEEVATGKRIRFGEMAKDRIIAARGK